VVFWGCGSVSHWRRQPARFRRVEVLPNDTITGDDGKVKSGDAVLLNGMISNRASFFSDHFAALVWLRSSQTETSLE